MPTPATGRPTRNVGMSETSRTVIKAFRVLDLFLERIQPLTLAELSHATGINKSTASRLCASLAQTGLLRRVGRGSYALGPKISQLCAAYKQQVDAEQIIRPILIELRDLSGESASFYVRSGDKRICLFRENSLQKIHHHREEGETLPLEGVAGDMLLAFDGRKGKLYDQIRRAGHHEADGLMPYTASIAVPVFAYDGGLLGALVVAGLSSRFHETLRAKTLERMKYHSLKLRQSFPTADMLGRHI